MPKNDRLAAWTEDISVIFDFEAVDRRSGNEFHAQFDLYHFGHSVTAHLDSCTGRYFRSLRKVSRDGMDSILIQLFLEGGVQFGVGQRTTYANAGDIVIFDLAQPLDNINRAFRHITMVWPRYLIEKFAPKIHRWHGLCLPRESPVVRLLRNHMMASYELAPRFSVDEGRRVEEASLSLISAAMQRETISIDPSSEPLALKEVLVYQIKRYIRANLSSVDQSPAKIAAHFGISVRHLYQLMQPVGGIASYQRRLRLQRCLSDLQNPDHDNRRISEIAYSWGFSNTATFNRNFREAFGIRPSEARERRETEIETRAMRNTSSSKKMAEHQEWFLALGI